MPPFAPSAYADRGAVGLLVPGAGSTVSRERALASLVRGRVVSSLVDLDGDARSELATARPTTTIYVALPPPGSHHNVVRYPVAIVGPGYRGLLTSRSTRIDGLVSLADIAPTAMAIAAGEKPPIRLAPTRDAAATLARLDARLARAHDARTGATLVLVGWLVAFAALGILGRSALAGRAAVLVAPVALATALVPARGRRRRPGTVVVALAVVTGAGLGAPRAPRERARARRRRASCSRSSSSSPSGRKSTRWRRSGRIPTAAAGSTASRTRSRRCCSPRPSPLRRGRRRGRRRRSACCCSSRSAGAGPGPTAAACSSSQRRSPCSWPGSRASGSRRPGSSLGVVGVLAVGLAVVGLDALLGGSSHVTDAVGGGPGTLFDDLDRRLRISWAGATSAAHTAFLCLLSLGGLAWLGVRGRHGR